MIEIDGSKGEGGGQIVRSSLALSAITGKPFVIRNVRAGRKKPGLKRQHVTCVNAAAQICSASASGATLESSVLVFEPGKLKCGQYHFQIGTAGSGPLVAQTVLPALMLADGGSSIIVEGGTHNPMAPSFDFLSRVYLPQVSKMGPVFEATLVSYGFYPVGGGKFAINIQPTDALKPLELMERGNKPVPLVTAIVSALPIHIAEREVDTIRRKMNWPPNCTNVIEASDPRGPGNVVLVELQSENVTEMFTSLGRRGVRAEQVAKNALKKAKAYLASDDIPVGEHLADQLMLPMGIAASQGNTSRFLTFSLTEHSRTHKRILELFLDIQIHFKESTDKVEVVIGPS